MTCLKSSQYKLKLGRVFMDFVADDVTVEQTCQNCGIVTNSDICRRCTTLNACKVCRRRLPEDCFDDHDPNVCQVYYTRLLLYLFYRYCPC